MIYLETALGCDTVWTNKKLDKCPTQRPMRRRHSNTTPQFRGEGGIGGRKWYRPKARPCRLCLQNVYRDRDAWSQLVSFKSTSPYKFLIGRPPIWGKGWSWGSGVVYPVTSRRIRHIRHTPFRSVYEPIAIHVLRGARSSPQFEGRSGAGGRK